MSTTTPFATRTEVEIIADTVIALMRGKLFAATIWNKQEAARLAKITPRALMEADERWQRRRLSVPVEGRPVLAQAPMAHPKQSESQERVWPTAKSAVKPTNVTTNHAARMSKPPRVTTSNGVSNMGASLSHVVEERLPGERVQPPTDWRDIAEATVRATETPDHLICSKCGKQRTPDKFHGSTKVCSWCVWRRRRNTLYLKEVGAAVLEVHDELVGSACTVCGKAFQPGDTVRPIDVLLVHEGCRTKAGVC